MNAQQPGGSDPVAVAERVFVLLDEGAYSATYKYAVLMAFLDLCFERTTATGVPPTVLTTRQLAEKVLELYWPQCVPYEDDQGCLRQGGVNARQQAELVRAVVNFRERHPAETSLWRARCADPGGVERLVREVEWKLIEMPLPRLQVVGGTEQRFLYEYGWTQQVRRAAISAYQSGDGSAFDNRLLLKPGIAEALLRLNTLLRPMIRREWLLQVQAFNRGRLPQSALETFLFDRDREALVAAAGPLRELQAARCFYCDDALTRGGEVDHFVPWVRYPNNAVENLVLAHERCNNNKRDFLAAAVHVQRWATRLHSATQDLERLALNHGLESAPGRSQSVALALYSQLPDAALVWAGYQTFVAYERERAQVRGALVRAA